MSKSTDLLRGRLVEGERLIDALEGVTLALAFVPYGGPMIDTAPDRKGNLAITDRRLIIQWDDNRFRMYSALGIYGLSERFHLPASSWPYQGILHLPGGLSLVVQPAVASPQSADNLSKFLTNALFSLGSKPNHDPAAVTASNAYEERRRE